MEECLQLHMRSCADLVINYGLWTTVTIFWLCTFSFLTVWILVSTFVFFKELF